MKILLIEDDKPIGSFIAKGLKQEGFNVDFFETVEQLNLTLNHINYDAAIIDIMLPGEDGLSFIEKLRQKGFDFPIIILSARHSTDDRIKGLKQGGDDYLTKPFSFSELLLRLRNLIRRHNNNKTNSDTREYGGIKIDRLQRRVERNGMVIDMPPREYALLELFIKNPKTVLSKTIILEQLWDYNFDPQTNVVDVLVSRLRSRIDRPFQKKLIHTVRGVGYICRDDT